MIKKDMDHILQVECGLEKDRSILVGVSGGPDSLCLMETLRTSGYPVIVAYFDHQLRPESALDGQMVEETANRLMLASFVDGANVRAHAEEQKLSIEEAARNLRYRFLFDLARQNHAQAVAVGHTANDQVETVLMHFLRGSGITGLKGMSFRTVLPFFDPEIPLVRPLLDVWREETVTFCAVNGLRPHYDSSNDSLNFQRNRIRHLLIPNLETYNPKFQDAVLRMSHSLNGDYLFVKETLETNWSEVVTSVEKEFIAFDFPLLSKCSLGLQRKMVKHAMQLLRPGVDITFSVLERATNLIKSDQSSSRVDLKAGLRMFREENQIFIGTLDAELPFDLWPQMPSEDPILITTPKLVMLAGGWKVSSEHWHLPALAREQAKHNNDHFQVWLDAERLPEELRLRSRHVGDHFAPLGMNGHSQKLSDFFVNEKVPQRARDRWPLLCAGDEIVWVPGYRSAHRYRMTDSTRKVVYFSIVRAPEKIS